MTALNLSQEVQGELFVNMKTDIKASDEGKAVLLTTPATTESGAPVGEGSYEGTQGYAESIENYLANADVDKDAADAAPRSSDEAALLKRAEAEAASRSRAPGE
jgi:hypothetical protein